MITKAPRVPAGFAKLLKAGLVEAGAPGPVAGAPHPVYVLGLDRPRLAAAKLVGLRCLLERGRGPRATAEVSVDARGRATAFSHVSHGPAAAETARLVRGGAQEIGYLRVPGLSLGAIWLGRAGATAVDGEALVPLRPLPPGWQARRYSPAEFEALLGAAAGRQLALHRSAAAASGTRSTRAAAPGRGRRARGPRSP